MSQTYKIIRWDPILNTNNITPTPIPVISIKPDKNFLSFINENKNVLLIKCHNTESQYENLLIHGFVDINNYLTPNTLPILLNSPWYGYPDLNGEIEIVSLL